MDTTCQTILKTIGVEFNHLNDLEGFMIPRETLLDMDRYH